MYYYAIFYLSFILVYLFICTFLTHVRYVNGAAFAAPRSFNLFLFFVFLNFTSMFFCFLVVIHTYQKYISMIISQTVTIFFLFYLF